MNVDVSTSTVINRSRELVSGYAAKPVIKSKPFEGGLMAYDETLAARLRKLLQGRTDVTERRMFGGLAFMYRDRMCWGIVGADLVVRVAEGEFEAAMRRRHVRPMDFTGRPLKGFVYVSPPGIQSPSALRSWLECGERFAKQAPTRKVRRKPSQRSSG